MRTPYFSYRHAYAVTVLDIRISVENIFDVTIKPCKAINMVLVESKDENGFIFTMPHDIGTNKQDKFIKEFNKAIKKLKERVNGN